MSSRRACCTAIFVRPRPPQDAVNGVPITHRRMRRSIPSSATEADPDVYSKHRYIVGRACVDVRPSPRRVCCRDRITFRANIWNAAYRRRTMYDPCCHRCRLRNEAKSQMPSSIRRTMMVRPSSSKARWTTRFSSSRKVRRRLQKPIKATMAKHSRLWWASWHAEIILVLRLHRPLSLSCLPLSFRY
jgi:hypothetical protein